MVSNQHRIIRYIAIAAILLGLIIVVILLIIPQGSYVNALIEVEDQNVSLQQCALKKQVLLNMFTPSEDISQGDRTIVLKIFHNQTELIAERCTRQHIGTGTCELKSGILPNDLPNAAELLIRVELYDANGLLITSAEDSLVYK